MINSNIQSAAEVAANASVVVSNDQKSNILNSVSQDGNIVEHMDINKLPPYLQEALKLVDGKTEASKDIFFTSLLAFAGYCLPAFYSYYGGKKYFPSIPYFAIGRSACGKGTMDDAKELLADVLSHIELSPDGRPTGIKAISRANTSAAAFLRNLSEAKGRMIMYAQEISEYTAAKKSDWATLLQTFMKNVPEHETIGAERAGKDSINITVTNPCVTFVMSGTPGDFLNTMSISQIEDGSANRFLYYHTNDFLPFDASYGVEPTTKELALKEFLVKRLRENLLQLYVGQMYDDQYAVRVKFTNSQQKEIGKLEEKYVGVGRELFGDLYDAYMKRLGYNIRRIATVLTGLRCVGADNHINLPAQSAELDVHTDDFEITKYLLEKFVWHSFAAFGLLLKEARIRCTPKMVLFDALPSDTEITKEDVKRYRNTLGLKGNEYSDDAVEKWVDRNVDKLFEKVGRGIYKKKAAPSAELIV